MAAAGGASDRPNIQVSATYNVGGLAGVVGSWFHTARFRLVQPFGGRISEQKTPMPFKQMKINKH